MDRLGLLVATTQSGHSSVHEMLAAASTPWHPSPRARAGAGRVREVADGLIDRAGWRIVSGLVDRDNLASVLEAILRYRSHSSDPSGADPYVRAADEIARSDIWHLDTSKDRLELLEDMVVARWCSASY